MSIFKYFALVIVLPALFFSSCNDSKRPPKKEAAFNPEQPIEEASPPDVVQNREATASPEIQQEALSEKTVTTTWVASWSSKE